MSFQVRVDPTNPGQFFACCGLLELADRLWPGAEGWFEKDARRFHVMCAGTLAEMLAIVVMDPPTEITVLECNNLGVKPIIAPLAFSFDGGSTTAITLDAWTKIQCLKGVPSVVANSPWNFWSGQQTALGIWSGLRAELVSQLQSFALTEYEDLFSQRLFQKGRFGFDPGPAWNALDAGFSPNEQGMEVESSPAVEILAAIGIQRFRPVMHESRESFCYYTWHRPMCPSVAAAAIAVAVSDSVSIQFHGCVVSRGQYAALGFAYPIRHGAYDE